MVKIKGGDSVGLSQISLSKELMKLLELREYDQIFTKLEENSIILEVVNFFEEDFGVVHKKLAEFFTPDVEYDFSLYKEEKPIDELHIQIFNSSKLQKLESFFGKSIFHPKPEEWLSTIIKRKLIHKKFASNSISVHQILGEYFTFKTLNSVNGTASESTKIFILNEIEHKLDEKKLGGMEKQEKSLIELLDSKFNLNSSNAIKSCLIYGSSGNGKTEFVNQICHKYQNSHSTQVIRFGSDQTQIKSLIGGIDKPNNIIFIIDDFEIHQEDSIHIIFGLLEIVKNSNTFLIGICEHVENINPVFRTSGNFEYEIYFPIPNNQQRKQIIQIYFPTLEEKLIQQLTDFTSGFVGKDIERLSKYAKLVTENEDELNWNVLSSILRSIQPSQLKDFGTKITNISFDQIGGYEKVKKKVRQILMLPFDGKIKKFNIPTSSGILLYGPSGNGKTLISKAMASLGKMNYVHFKAPELFSKYYGETEKIIREIFTKARELEPCVLVFDEIDSIGSSRTNSDSDSGTSSRVLTQLLTEMDGIQEKKQIFLVGCTNQIDAMDEALLRPGRLDQLIYVGYPDENDRKEIFEILKRKMPFDDEVDFALLCQKTKNFSCSKIVSLCNEAAITALREDMNNQKIRQAHFKF